MRTAKLLSIASATNKKSMNLRGSAGPRRSARRTPQSNRFISCCFPCTQHPAGREPSRVPRPHAFSMHAWRVAHAAAAVPQHVYIGPEGNTMHPRHRAARGSRPGNREGQAKLAIERWRATNRSASSWLWPRSSPRRRVRWTTSTCTTGSASNRARGPATTRTPPPLTTSSPPRTATTPPGARTSRPSPGAASARTGASASASRTCRPNATTSASSPTASASHPVCAHSRQDPYIHYSWNPNRILSIHVLIYFCM